MKTIRRLKTFLIAAAMLAASITMLPMNAVAADYSNYGLGDLSISQAEEEEYFSQFPGADSDISFSDIQLETSVDLSTSEYFPPIGNQGALNSCVSWATTYYQFTYEANKLNELTTTAENAYSPA